MKKIFLLLPLLMATLYSSAQVTREEMMKNICQAAGTYYPYWGGKAKLTPAPEGYQPFYISHYGRHGSRYLTKHDSYHKLIPLLEKAQEKGVLTSQGKKTLKQMKKAYSYAKGKSGQLSILGGRQHEGIAQRMGKNFPEVFQSGCFVDARSTQVGRCQESMAHFCGQLKKDFPYLDISQQSNREDYYFMANRTDSVKSVPASKAIKEGAYAFRNKMRSTPDPWPRLISDPAFIKKYVKDKSAYNMYLFDIVTNMMCHPEQGIRFSGEFTKEELFCLWQAKNIQWTISTGTIDGVTPRYQRIYGLIRNFIVWADEVIAQGTRGASLRFGHDSFVYPLAYALHLDHCDDVPQGNYEELYRHMANFKIIPMAGNVQLIFYRKPGSDDILVKFLLQEEEKHIPVPTDVWPYYHWNDVRKYYLDMVAQKQIKTD